MKTLTKTFMCAAMGLPLVACGPSPEAVCDHTIELTKKEFGEEAAKALDRDDCIKQAERRKEIQGLMKYRKEASCVVDASNIEELQKCNQLD